MTSGSTAERRPTVEPAELEGPITVGTMSPPVDPRPLNLGGVGYVEEEWFALGTATSYLVDGEFCEDGRWQVQPASTARTGTGWSSAGPTTASGSRDQWWWSG